MCGWFALVTVSSIQCNTYNIITWVLILMRHITHIIYTKASIWYLTFFHIAFPFSRYFVLFLYLWVYVFDAHFYSKVSCRVHIVDCVVFQYFFLLYYEWWRTDVVSYGVNLTIFNTRNNGKNYILWESAKFQEEKNLDQAFSMILNKCLECRKSFSIDRFEVRITFNSQPVKLY